jgi:hypothetical protein
MLYLLAESWYPYLPAFGYVTSNILRLVPPKGREQSGIYHSSGALSTEKCSQICAVPIKVSLADGIEWKVLSDGRRRSKAAV